MSVTIEVSVRLTNGTYFARGNGKTASCTYDPVVAVKSVGRKVFGNLQKLVITQVKPVTVVTVYEKGQFLVTPDLSQSCRVCGCTWDCACGSGCYWVAEDLCSNCGGDA